MLERDTLRLDFARILRSQRHSARRLNDLLRSIEDPRLRQTVAQLQANAGRDLELTRRLVEMVR